MSRAADQPRPRTESFGIGSDTPTGVPYPTRVTWFAPHKQAASKQAVRDFTVDAFPAAR